MEKLAGRLAHKIAVSLHYDNEREKVVAYGLIALIQMVVTILGVLIIGLIIKTPVESLIICFAVSILRKYSGGAHAGSILKCTLIAVIYCTVFAFIGRYLLSAVIGWLEMLFILIAVFAAAFFIVYRLAPVDSPNKPIGSMTKRLKMKRRALMVLAIYLALSVFLVFMSNYKDNAAYISYCLSLLFGIIWQVFTLTKIGSFVLTRVENSTISKERRLD